MLRRDAQWGSHNWFRLRTAAQMLACRADCNSIPARCALNIQIDKQTARKCTVWSAVIIVIIMRAQHTTCVCVYIFICARGCRARPRVELFNDATGPQGPIGLCSALCVWDWCTCVRVLIIMRVIITDTHTHGRRARKQPRRFMTMIRCEARGFGCCTCRFFQYHFYVVRVLDDQHTNAHARESHDDGQFSGTALPNDWPVRLFGN